MLSPAEPLAYALPRDTDSLGGDSGGYIQRTVCHPEVLIQVNVVRQLADPAA
jgi:hypothetical protein